MKNVVVFGGGTGLSHILSGLKLFPVNVTAIISVSDNGSSTGVLKEEMNMPAIGDIATVMISMANVSDDMRGMLKYRFKKDTSLDNHPIKNLLLASLYDIKGNLTDAIEIMCNMLNINGTILPITEDKVELVGHFKSGAIIEGEEQITKHNEKIEELTYNKPFKINKRVLKAIDEADLIIFSPGSLYTSILPHLIIPEVAFRINSREVPKMYVSNLFTQPGETDHFKVSDHINVLRKYVNVDTVIANNGELPIEFAKKYETLEQKDVVKIDRDTLDEMDINVISDKIFTLEDGIIRHDALKTAYLIFSFLMNGDK